MKIQYVCEHCNQPGPTRSWFFECLWCGKEICGSCLDLMASCKECAAGKTEEELSARYYEAYPDEDGDLRTETAANEGITGAPTGTQMDRAAITQP